MRVRYGRNGRARSRSWQVGVQLGLLTAVALVMVRGPSLPASAAPLCAKEAMCTLTKPLVLFVVDYSTAMNTKYNPYSTRWGAAVGAIGSLLVADNGLLDTHFMLGLVRYGHDPDPDQPGTAIPGDASGLIDATRLDVAPYDLVDPGHAYYECSNAAAIQQTLKDLPPPLAGALTGIDRWTWGGLDRARAVLDQSKLDHPDDLDGRPAAVVLVTGGPWTGPAGGEPLAPPWQDPTLVAHDLYTNSGVPTYVVTLGEANNAPFAAALAAEGGTGNPLAIACPAYPSSAMLPLVEPLKDSITGSCGQGVPRVMLLLDSSSSMLNVAWKHAGQGMGGWEQAREVLAGPSSFFDFLVPNTTTHVEDLVHVGLTVFGFNAPPEEKVVVDYGPCLKDNIAWALDPVTSCVAPGCTDPWGAPPITWTFKDGAKEAGFAATTLSHMPRCLAAQNLPGACVGSGTYTHLGLQLVAQNLATYKQTCMQPTAIYGCSDTTEYVNILITDGDYNSTDAQVKAPLEAMYSDGVTTHVIGFGDLVISPASVTKLNNMASWGSGGQRLAHKAPAQVDLELALQTIFSELLADVAADPCCTGSCGYHPEPTTDEPDPPPETTWGEFCAWDSGSSSSTTDPTTSGSTSDSTSGATTDSTTGTTTSTGSTDGTAGDPSTSSQGTSATTTPAPTPTSGDAGTGATSEGSSSSTGPGEAGEDDGCACTADDAGGSRLGLWLPLALLLRRRRQ